MHVLSKVGMVDNLVGVVSFTEAAKTSGTMLVPVEKSTAQNGTRSLRFLEATTREQAGHGVRHEAKTLGPRARLNDVPLPEA